MKRIVVGGIPNPIGGVTSFISRLVDNDMVSEIIDIYPSSKKCLSKTFTGKFTELSGLLALYIYFFKNYKNWSGKKVHFNFSRPHSLFFMFLLPKFGASFELMLHHGELKVGIWGGIYKLILRKFNIIYVLSDSQKDFYIELNVRTSKMIIISSYVEPSLNVFNINCKVKSEIDMFFTDSINIVASGYPTNIYNHSWAYKFALENKNIHLALFLYGEHITSEKLDLLGLKDHERVKIFQQVDQDSFNYVLSKADIYVRPTTKDSFGIAVADAINLGAKVLASDVCERYPGANLFTPNDYESFSINLHNLIQGKNKNIQESVNFCKFTYN